MDKVALSSAKDRFARAQAKIDAMATAKTLDEMADFWEEFLGEAVRFFGRLRRASGGGPNKLWFDKILEEHKKDDLLAYMVHARNAHEHGVERITEVKGANILVGFRGQMPRYIEHISFSMENGVPVITADAATAKELKVDFRPGEVLLVAVKNRGQIYAAPTSHRGTKIEEPTALVASGLLLNYMKEKLAEAEAKA